MCSTINKQSFPPCTSNHDIEELGIPYGPFLEIEKSSFMFYNLSFGPIKPEESDEIFFTQLSSLSNTESSFYPYPADSYRNHVNTETGQELPYCCDYHKQVIVEANNWFNVFPDCCSRHKEMSQNDWFEKAAYSYVPEKIVLLLAQTEHLITEQIENPDWEDAITSYIDYNFICFHHYAVGLNIYLNNLERFIFENEPTIPVNKAKIIVDHIRYIGKYYQLSESKYKFQVLEQWIHTFPFNTSYFKSRNITNKEELIPLPFDTKTGEFKYDLTRYIINNKKVLASLLRITSIMISSTHKYDTNLLSYSEKKELELLRDKRKLKLKYNYSLDSSKKPGYVRLLEEWLTDEIEYLREIKPLLSKLAPNVFDTEGIEHISTDFETSDTRKFIEEKFSDIGSKDKYGWEYAFRKKSDYELFVDLLEKFFRHQEYSLPSDTIELRYGSKTQVATALGLIHGELGEKLSSDKSFFKIVQVLSHFQHETQASLYKALTRHRS